MSRFGQSLNKVFTGAAGSFIRYPAAIISALVIVVSASVLIQSDQLTYDKNYQSLQLGFLVAAAIGLVVVGLGLNRRLSAIWFWGLNGLTLAVGFLLFMVINQGTGQIPELTIVRVIVAASVFVLSFLLLISRRGTGSDFNQASFMTLKSAMIALLYAAVILLGLFFIAFSVENLLYQNMDEKIYLHIAVWSGFFWFAFFLGYLPDFSLKGADTHLETAQKQPRFIEILFLYVLIPILTMLSVVLLIWAIQILIVGQWPDFPQLLAIFSGYAILGIWLVIMTSRNDQPAARWFCRLYPPVLLLFLAFEAYAIIHQILSVHIRTGEYVVVLIWLYAFLSALVLLIKPVVKNWMTAFFAIILLTVSVLPIIGYQPVAIKSQAQRLHQVLSENDMIVDGRIQPPAKTLDQEEKEVIRDAAGFLLRQQEKNIRITPWFDQSISQRTAFADVFGFSEYEDNWPMPPGDQIQIFLNLPEGTIDLTGYHYVVPINGYNQNEIFRVEGQKGVYELTTHQNQTMRLSDSLMTLKKDDEPMLHIDFGPEIERLAEKYKTISAKDSIADFDDLVYRHETDSIRIMIVFQSIQIYENEQDDLVYHVDMNAVYLGEK